MVLRFRTDERDVAASEVYQSIVGGGLQYWRGGAIKERVSPGDPSASAIVARMSARGNDDQMPPIATEEIDPDGVASVANWILSLQ